MQQDSIQKATSVDITPQRKGSFLRPVTVRGDSFRSELDGSGKAGKPPRPISTGSLRPISTGTSTVHWPSSPAARSSYQPEWAQDTENVLLPAATVDDHGSPEDLKDMLRMGRTQEMRSIQTILPDIFWLFVAMYLGVRATVRHLKRSENFNTVLTGQQQQSSFTGRRSSSVVLVLVPSSGGQYVWVSEFADKRCQSFLSYIAGYMTLIGWQCGNASGIFLTGSLIQCIITIYRPENGAIMWQTVVFLLPCVAFVILVNIYGGRAMAISQNISMSVHILALIAVVVIMWVLSPHIPTGRALFRIENTEWSSTALAMLAGQANMNYSCSYSDSPVHLSEEVQDAAIVVPKVIMRSLWISGICGLLVVVTFVFCIPSVADALSHPTGYSFLYVMQLSVPNGVIVCVLLVLLGLVGSSSIGFAAATARITYAFARDQGLPFSQWIGKLMETGQQESQYTNKRRATHCCSQCTVITDQPRIVVRILWNCDTWTSNTIAIVHIGDRKCTLPPHQIARNTAKSTLESWRVLEACDHQYACNHLLDEQLHLVVFTTNFASDIDELQSVRGVVCWRFGSDDGNVLSSSQALVCATGGAYQRHPNWNLSHLSTGQNVQFLTIPEEF
ncbi:unnamed protein product, partial [Aureobasidium pullulans]